LGENPGLPIRFVWARNELGWVVKGHASELGERNVELFDDVSELDGDVVIDVWVVHDASDRRHSPNEVAGHAIVHINSAAVVARIGGGRLRVPTGRVEGLAHARRPIAPDPPQYEAERFSVAGVWDAEAGTNTHGMASSESGQSAGGSLR
jgi:hypothetical protein